MASKGNRPTKKALGMMERGPRKNGSGGNLASLAIAASGALAVLAAESDEQSDSNRAITAAAALPERLTDFDVGPIAVAAAQLASVFSSVLSGSWINGTAAVVVELEQSKTDELYELPAGSSPVSVSLGDIGASPFIAAKPSGAGALLLAGALPTARSSGADANSPPSLTAETKSGAEDDRAAENPDDSALEDWFAEFDVSTDPGFVEAEPIYAIKAVSDELVAAFDEAYDSGFFVPPLLAGGGGGGALGGAAGGAAGGGSFAGRVFDGPISGLRVFVDANGDGEWQAGEQVTYTDSYGAYSFSGEVSADASIVARTYTLYDRAFVDANGDGVWNEGETFTYTDFWGNYEFDETLADGTTVLLEAAPNSLTLVLGYDELQQIDMQVSFESSGSNPYVSPLTTAIAGASEEKAAEILAVFGVSGSQIGADPFQVVGGEIGLSTSAAAAEVVKAGTALLTMAKQAADVAAQFDPTSTFEDSLSAVLGSFKNSSSAELSALGGDTEGDFTSALVGITQKALATKGKTITAAQATDLTDLMGAAYQAVKAVKSIDVSAAGGLANIQNTAGAVSEVAKTFLSASIGKIVTSEGGLSASDKAALKSAVSLLNAADLANIAANRATRASFKNSESVFIESPGASGSTEVKTYADLNVLGNDFLTLKSSQFPTNQDVTIQIYGELIEIPSGSSLSDVRDKLKETLKDQKFSGVNIDYTDLDGGAVKLAITYPSSAATKPAPDLSALHSFEIIDAIAYSNAASRATFSLANGVDGYDGSFNGVTPTGQKVSEVFSNRLSYHILGEFQRITLKGDIPTGELIVGGEEVTVNQSDTPDLRAVAEAIVQKLVATGVFVEHTSGLKQTELGHLRVLDVSQDEQGNWGVDVYVSAQEGNLATVTIDTSNLKGSTFSATATSSGSPFKSLGEQQLITLDLGLSVVLKEDKAAQPTSDPTDLSISYDGQSIGLSAVTDKASLFSLLKNKAVDFGISAELSHTDDGLQILTFRNLLQSELNKWSFEGLDTTFGLNISVDRQTIPTGGFAQGTKITIGDTTVVLDGLKTMDEVLKQIKVAYETDNDPFVSGQRITTNQINGSLGTVALSFNAHDDTSSGEGYLGLLDQVSKSHVDQINRSGGEGYINTLVAGDTFLSATVEKIAPQEWRELLVVRTGDVPIAEKHWVSLDSNSFPTAAGTAFHVSGKEIEIPEGSTLAEALDILAREMVMLDTDSFPNSEAMYFSISGEQIEIPEGSTLRAAVDIVSEKVESSTALESWIMPTIVKHVTDAGTVQLSLYYPSGYDAPEPFWGDLQTDSEILVDVGADPITYAVVSWDPSNQDQANEISPSIFDLNYKPGDETFNANAASILGEFVAYDLNSMRQAAAIDGVTVLSPRTDQAISSDYLTIQIDSSAYEDAFSQQFSVLYLVDDGTNIPVQSIATVNVSPAVPETKFLEVDQQGNKVAIAEDEKVVLDETLDDVLATVNPLWLEIATAVNGVGGLGGNGSLVISGLPTGSTLFFVDQDGKLEREIPSGATGDVWTITGTEIFSNFRDDLAFTLDENYSGNFTIVVNAENRFATLSARDRATLQYEVNSVVDGFEPLTAEDIENFDHDFVPESAIVELAEPLANGVAKTYWIFNEESGETAYSNSTLVNFFKDSVIKTYDPGQGLVVKLTVSAGTNEAPQDPLGLLDADKPLIVDSAWKQVGSQLEYVYQVPEGFASDGTIEVAAQLAQAIAKIGINPASNASGTLNFGLQIGTYDVPLESDTDDLGDVKWLSASDSQPYVLSDTLVIEPKAGIAEGQITMEPWGVDEDDNPIYIRESAADQSFKFSFNLSAADADEILSLAVKAVSGPFFEIVDSLTGLQILSELQPFNGEDWTVYTFLREGDVVRSGGFQIRAKSTDDLGGLRDLDLVVGVVSSEGEIKNGLIKLSGVLAEQFQNLNATENLIPNSIPFYTPPLAPTVVAKSTGSLTEDEETPLGDLILLSGRDPAALKLYLSKSFMSGEEEVGIKITADGDDVVIEEDDYWLVDLLKTNQTDFVVADLSSIKVSVTTPNFQGAVELSGYVEDTVSKPFSNDVVTARSPFGSAESSFLFPVAPRADGFILSDNLATEYTNSALKPPASIYEDGNWRAGGDDVIDLSFIFRSAEAAPDGSVIPVIQQLDPLETFTGALVFATEASAIGSFNLVNLEDGSAAHPIYFSNPSGSSGRVSLTGDDIRGLMVGDYQLTFKPAGAAVGITGVELVISSDNGADKKLDSFLFDLTISDDPLQPNASVSNALGPEDTLIAVDIQLKEASSREGFESKGLHVYLMSADSVTNLDGGGVPTISPNIWFAEVDNAGIVIGKFGYDDDLGGWNIFSDGGVNLANVRMFFDNDATDSTPIANVSGQFNFEFVSYAVANGKNTLDVLSDEDYAALRESFSVMVSPQAEVISLKGEAFTLSIAEEQKSFGWTSLGLKDKIDFQKLGGGAADDDEVLVVELSGIPAGLTIGTGTGDQFVAIQKSAGTSVIYVPLAQAETLLGNYTLRYKADLSGEYPISMKAYGMEPANGDTSGASLATLTVDIAGSVRSPDAPLLLHNTAVSISEQQVRLEEAPFLKTALAAGSYVSVSDRVRLSSEVPKDSSEQLRVIVSNNTDLRYYKLIVDDLGAERFQILQATPENSGEFSLTVSDFKNLYVTAPRFDSYTIEKTFTVRTELIEGDYQQDFSTGSEADRSDPIDVSILVKSVASGVDQTGLKAKVITSLDAREDELGEISLRDFFSSDVGNLPDYLIDETGEALRLKVYFDASKVRLIRTVGSSNPVVQNDAKAPQGTPNYVVVDGADIENIVLSTPNNAVGELKFNLKAYSKESDGSKSTEVDLGVVQVDVKPVIDFGEGDLRLPQQVNARLWSADKASVPIILNFTDAEELVDAQTSVRLTFTAGGRVLKSDSISLYYGDSADHGALILSADGTSLTRELHSNVQKDLLLIKKLALLKVDSSEDFRGDEAVKLTVDVDVSQGVTTNRTVTDTTTIEIYQQVAAPGIQVDYVQNQDNQDQDTFLDVGILKLTLLDLDTLPMDEPLDNISIMISGVPPNVYFLDDHPSDGTTQAAPVGAYLGDGIWLLTASELFSSESNKAPLYMVGNGESSATFKFQTSVFDPVGGSSASLSELNAITKEVSFVTTGGYAVNAGDDPVVFNIPGGDNVDAPNQQTEVVLATVFADTDAVGYDWVPGFPDSDLYGYYLKLEASDFNDIDSLGKIALYQSFLFQNLADLEVAGLTGKVYGWIDANKDWQIDKDEIKSLTYTIADGFEREGHVLTSWAHVAGTPFSNPLPEPPKVKISVSGTYGEDQGAPEFTLEVESGLTLDPGQRAFLKVFVTDPDTGQAAPNVSLDTGSLTKTASGEFWLFEVDSDFVKGDREEVWKAVLPEHYEGTFSIQSSLLFSYVDLFNQLPFVAQGDVSEAKDITVNPVQDVPNLFASQTGFKNSYREGEEILLAHVAEISTPDAKETNDLNFLVKVAYYDDPDKFLGADTLGISGITEPDDLGRWLISSDSISSSKIDLTDNFFSGDLLIQVQGVAIDKVLAIDSDGKEFFEEISRTLSEETIQHIVSVAPVSNGIALNELGEPSAMVKAEERTISEGQNAQFSLTYTLVDEKEVASGKLEIGITNPDGTEPAAGQGISIENLYPDVVEIIDTTFDSEKLVWVVSWQALSAGSQSPVSTKKPTFDVIAGEGFDGTVSAALTEISTTQFGALAHTINPLDLDAEVAIKPDAIDDSQVAFDFALTVSGPSNTALGDSLNGFILNEGQGSYELKLSPIEFTENDLSLDVDSLSLKFDDSEIPGYFTISEKSGSDGGPYTWKLEVNPSHTIEPNALKLSFTVLDTATDENDNQSKELVRKYSVELVQGADKPQFDENPPAEFDLKDGDTQIISIPQGYITIDDRGNPSWQSDDDLYFQLRDITAFGPDQTHSDLQLVFGEKADGIWSEEIAVEAISSFQDDQGTRVYQIDITTLLGEVQVSSFDELLISDKYTFGLKSSRSYLTQDIPHTLEWSAFTIETDEAEPIVSALDATKQEVTVEVLLEAPSITLPGALSFDQEYAQIDFFKSASLIGAKAGGFDTDWLEANLLFDIGIDNVDYEIVKDGTSFVIQEKAEKTLVSSAVNGLTYEQFTGLQIKPSEGVFGDAPVTVQVTPHLDRLDLVTNQLEPVFGSAKSVTFSVNNMPGEASTLLLDQTPLSFSEGKDGEDLSGHWIFLSKDLSTGSGYVSIDSLTEGLLAYVDLSAELELYSESSGHAVKLNGTAADLTYQKGGQEVTKSVVRYQFDTEQNAANFKTIYFREVDGKKEIVEADVPGAVEALTLDGIFVRPPVGAFGTDYVIAASASLVTSADGKVGKVSEDDSHVEIHVTPTLDKPQVVYTAATDLTFGKYEYKVNELAKDGDFYSAVDFKVSSTQGEYATVSISLSESDKTQLANLGLDYELQYLDIASKKWMLYTDGDSIGTKLSGINSYKFKVKVIDDPDQTESSLAPTDYVSDLDSSDVIDDALDFTITVSPYFIDDAWNAVPGPDDIVTTELALVVRNSNDIPVAHQSTDPGGYLIEFDEPSLSEKQSRSIDILFRDPDPGENFTLAVTPKDDQQSKLYGTLKADLISLHGDDGEYKMPIDGEYKMPIRLEFGDDIDALQGLWVTEAPHIQAYEVRVLDSGLNPSNSVDVTVEITGLNDVIEFSAQASQVVQVTSADKVISYASGWQTLYGGGGVASAVEFSKVLEFFEHDLAQSTSNYDVSLGVVTVSQDSAVNRLFGGYDSALGVNLIHINGDKLDKAVDKNLGEITLNFDALTDHISFLLPGEVLSFEYTLTVEETYNTTGRPEGVVTLSSIEFTYEAVVSDVNTQSYAEQLTIVLPRLSDLLTDSAYQSQLFGDNIFDALSMGAEDVLVFDTTVTDSDGVPFVDVAIPGWSLVRPQISSNRDDFFGSEGRDFVQFNNTAYNGGGLIFGNDGHDVILAGGGRDLIILSPGVDYVSGGDGRDAILIASDFADNKSSSFLFDEAKIADDFISLCQEVGVGSDDQALADAFSVVVGASGGGSVYVAGYVDLTAGASYAVDGGPTKEADDLIFTGFEENYSVEKIDESHSLIYAKTTGGDTAVVILQLESESDYDVLFVDHTTGRTADDVIGSQNLIDSPVSSGYLSDEGKFVVNHLEDTNVASDMSVLGLTLETEQNDPLLST